MIAHPGQTHADTFCGELGENLLSGRDYFSFLVFCLQAKRVDCCCAFVFEHHTALYLGSFALSQGLGWNIFVIHESPLFGCAVADGGEKLMRFLCLLPLPQTPSC